MSMYIIKRNGEEVPFEQKKIANAIMKANTSVADNQKCPQEMAEFIAKNITADLQDLGDTPTVEGVQDRVQDALSKHGFIVLARKYANYRYQHASMRDETDFFARIGAIIEDRNELTKQENSNKNPTVNSVQRDYMAGEISRELTKRQFLPKDIVDAHERGIIHFHDSDYYAQHMHNCCLVNLEDMLQNGTVISEVMIEKPHSFATACNIATQAIAQIASAQYGGQSITLSHLVPFVDVSRQKYRRAVRAEFKESGIEATEEQMDRIAESRVREEVNRGVQVIQYQVITLMTTNGQAPFITVYMYLDEVPEGQMRDDLAMVIEETLKQRIQGVKNESGHWVTPAFPKLIYVLDEDNIHEDSKYYYLTKLAAKCTAKRMVPDYISAKMMKEYKNGDVYPCMGCRSFLTPDTQSLGPNGEHKYYGRFNQGVVTINLPYIGCLADGNMDKFWELFEEYLELCHRALRLRHERLVGTKSDVAPILWQNGALARLKRGEEITPLLYNNYSTISLGYAGLYELCIRMTGKTHTDPETKPFALAVMQKMNDKCAEWRAAENISYSLYGTPIESTTYKFAKALKRDFGVIPNVSSHNYITNSYHVNVREEIDAFTKLKFESDFQKLSPGGAISYVEVPNMMNNLDAVMTIIEYIYDNIMYAELNTKSDYCQKCGYEGEIQIVEENGKLIWECPNCGNRAQNTMNVARRTCGYIGTQYWNQGRTQEIKERVLHV